MSRPDYAAMIDANAQVNMQINKILVLLVPNEVGTTINPSPEVIRYAEARIGMAHQQLDRMTRALKGGA